jgi:hypothetical protein
MGSVLALLLLAFSARSDLPVAARELLDREYPGWRLAPVAVQVRDWFEQQRFSYAPNLARGDFDNDGKPDWALEIVAGGVQHTLVLLNRGEGFAGNLLASDGPDPFTYLIVNRRGDREFSFETLRWFRHTRNSLLLMYFDRTPWLFSWTGSRFDKKLAPSDEEMDSH